MIYYPFGSNKLKAQSLNNSHRSRTIATKFAKILFTVSLSICLLLGPISRAMSRDEVPGQSSSTSTDQSTVNPINRAKAPGPMMILYGTMENADTFVRPPPLLKLSQQGSDSRGAESQFIVTYRGFTPEAQAAFQYAVNIWDSLIRSPVLIRIEATFRDKGGYEDGSITLGSARPAGRRGSASLGVWVARALADNQVGRDLNVGEPDIITSFNSHAAVDWYFGTDGNTPSGKQDFVSVVLHEIGHGLGFFSSATVDFFSIEILSFSVERGQLRSGNPELPEIYDIFVENGTGEKIIAFSDPSTALLDAFTGNNLFWNGEKGVEAHGGIRPKLYAPNTWNQGSSYSHLDEDTFPAGDPNALMTPGLSRAEAIHHPGPITLGIFEDMGWTINKGPAFTDGSSTTRSVAENTGAGVNIGSPVAATDANSADPNANLRDSLTYTLSGIDAGSFAIEGATGQLKTLAALDYETKRAYTVTVTVSDGRLIDEIAVTITVTDVDETPTNSPPVFTDGPSATRTVAENTGAGVNIGSPVAATDADSGDTLTYTLGGADAAAFDIISTTGQLKTKVALDYETKATHSVTVTVDDGSFTVSIAVTINVNNINDVAPAFIEGASTTRSVVENTASGVDIGRPVAATDADNDSLTYTLSGTDSASFEVDRTSGQLRTKAALDYETKTAYNTVTLTVSDGSHTASITVTVEVTDVVETPTNRGPVFTEGSTTTRTVAENTARRENIGSPVAATDADNDSLTYTLSGADAAVFDIISTTGQLRTEAKLDHETQKAYMVTVAVSDDSLTDSISVTITVTDVPEVSTNNAPAFTEGSSTIRSVPENTTRGVNIGNPVVATDADSGTTLIYSLGGPSASSFDIEPLSGQLRTKRALNYETRDSYTVTVTVTDGSLTDSITVTITVTDVPESPTNRGPVFTEGSRTTRSVAENTRAGVNIGLPVSATDPDSGDTLTYTLGGSDASSFDIEGTSGQLRIRAALDYETRASYSVTVTVSDGSLSDEITVTISVTDVPETPTNRGPVFTEGSTTRSVAENTAAGVNIGAPVAATDADNDSLTYTPSGLDAASFAIGRTSGQLRTRAALDYETRTSYTVIVTVSDGSLTDTITVTIAVTDQDDLRSPTVTLASQPLTEATLNGSMVTLRLRERKYEEWLSDPVTASGIPGVTVRPSDIDRVSDTELQAKLTFDGTDFDTNARLTFTVKADAIANYNGPALTTTAPVTAGIESVGASTATPLREATLNGSTVTLTLSGGVYEARYTVGNNVTVSGIAGVTVNRFDVDRVSDTQVAVELIFDGTDFDTDAALTFTVEPDAVAGYNGAALIAQLPVIPVVEENPTVTASTPQPLTEATLNQSLVILTLNSGVYVPSRSDISRAVQVAGLGVTFSRFNVARISDTQVTVQLTYDGTDFDTDATLTFTIGAAAIANYNGPALITEIPVTAVVEERPTITVLTPQPFTEATLDGIILLTLNNGTYVSSTSDIRNAITVSGIVGLTVGRYVRRESDTQIAVELEYNGNIDTDATLTFTVGADAIAGYDGPALIVQVSVTGGTESVAASTPTALTESALHGSVVTLTLNGATYERSTFDLRDAVEISGIDGVTYHWFDLERVSDTALTVELKFNGNIDTDATLTFTVGADAIAGYNGPALITTLPVTAGKESVVASTSAPLTESTLDGTVVTLTLNGATYARSIFTTRDAVTVSGIDGVTIPWHDPDRESDTVITVELEFNGNIDTDATLKFTVGADAMARYNGPALIATLPVTAGQESIVASTSAPLTESTLDGTVVTLTLNGATYARSFDIRNGVTVSGIDGVTIPWHDPDRESDTVITVELEFNGNIDTDATLKFTVGADAMARYNGPALIATLPVTAGQESIVASTSAPLTESTLDGTVVTLTLNGATYARSIFTTRDAVTVSGIDGITIPWHDPDRESDTEITVELEFNGNFDTDATLTFTVGAGAIAGYNGPALIATLPVTAGQESIVASTSAPLTESTLDGSVVTLTLNGATYARIFDIRDGVTVSGVPGVTVGTFGIDRESDTEVTVELEFEGNIDTDATLKFTVGADAMARYNGPALIATLPVTAVQELIVASTDAPLTESTLDESVVTLTLNGATYERSIFDLRDAVEISGIDGVTYHWFDLERVSDTELTVELKFNGNIDTDATLTFTVGADALVGYNGPALIATLPVTGGKESVVVSTDAPLTEATLDEGVVTLTLIGGVYESEYTVGKNVTVSGIAGVTFRSYNVDRISDTVITIELEFEGNIDTDAILTFTVGADALVGYNGPALIAQLLVTTGQTPAASLVASTQAPLTEATLDGSVVTLTLTGGAYERSLRDIRGAVTVSGISGVTVGTLGIGRVSDTVVTVELTFNGNLHVDATLIFTVGADAIANYNGPALTAILPVTAVVEAVVKENPTIAETSLMAIEGTIKTEDGIPAEAGLQVTVIIGSNTQTGVSEVGGVYTVTIFNLQGDVVAISGDTVTVQVRNPDTGASVERTVQLSSKQILDKQAIIDLQFSPTPSTTGREYLLSVPAGISLIHVPLKVTAVDGVAQTIESVGDLYDALGGSATVELLITYDPETGRWNSYLHDGHRGRPGDKALTDDLGIITSMKVAKSVRLSGDALGTNGRSSITLHPGINLVGVPLKDSRITRVSNLLKLNGIAGNVSVIIVSDNGFKVVAQAEDPGDIPVTGGGAFILTARNAATVEITGTKWSNPLGQTAAPSTALTGIQTDGVTPVLAVSGSISPVSRKSLSRPFKVTIKNRSTGTVDTAMTDDDGVSYQFTFVDIETSRAGQVGDILEITAYSPDPFVGIQPVWHTVTDEDVKRSWISLGELVTYEIPAKTELLSNYPNPFNPETWIPYRLAEDAFVTLTIYDPRGRVVRQLEVGHRIAAVYESRSKAIYWDGRTEFGERVASGIYFYTLTAGDYSATRKMVILK